MNTRVKYAKNCATALPQVLPHVTSEEMLNRAVGALQGLALGDALGMPTQSMSAQWIREAYGSIDGLNDAIEHQPIAPRMPAGSITDDTEQALIVAQLIIDGQGHIDALALAHRLLDWEDDMKRRGSFDLLEPSTKLALEQIRQGADSRTTGRTGTTNGAAMRVAPVGIANPSHDIDRLAHRIYESCKVTHNTVHGFESAAMVATAVSLGIDGASVHDALEGAVDAVSAMQSHIQNFDCAWSPKADVMARVRKALDIAYVQSSESDFLHALQYECGTSVESNESIPVACALAWRYNNDPFKALCVAASLGGDTDTIAAICGAILGAAGMAHLFPDGVVETVTEVSHLQLLPVAEGLLAVRR